VIHASATAVYSHRTWYSLSLEYIRRVGHSGDGSDKAPVTARASLSSHHGSGPFMLPPDSGQIVRQIMDGVLVDVGCLGQDIMHRDTGGQFQVTVGDGVFGVVKAD
jgi:hypothetical protein